MKAQAITVRQGVLRWLEDQGHLRPVTLEGYASVGRLLSRSFGADAPLRVLTPKALQALFRTERGRVKASTYTYERRVTKLFTSWARRQGFISQDGMVDVRPVRVTPATPRVLEESVENLLLREADPQLRGFIVLAIETGLRRRALLSMKWEHVDLVGGRLALPGELLKSGRELRVPLTQRAWDMLRALKAVSTSPLVLPISASTLSDHWLKAVRLLGLGGLKIHDLRKTFLTRCRQKGIPLEVAMRLSDHTDVKTALQVYRLVDDNELLRAVDRDPDWIPRKVETQWPVSR